MPKHVLFVRHGETDGNRNKTLQLPTINLNANGFQQAALVGARLANHEMTGLPKVHKVLSSDLQRTQDTAKEIVNATGRPLKLTNLLVERNFGSLRGKKFSYLADNNINPFAKGYTPPDGESMFMLAARMHKAWELVLEEAETVPDEEALVVVSHGLILDFIAKNFLNISQELKDRHIIPFLNTSVTWVNVGESHMAPFPVVKNVFNCDKHLSEEHRDPDFPKLLNGKANVSSI